MLAAAAATLALMGGAGDPGYDFARSLALAGPRPAAGAAERTAHRRVAEAFRAAGPERHPRPLHGAGPWTVAQRDRRRRDARAAACGS